jgi:tRNA pseudouridine55 synthase
MSSAPFGFLNINKPAGITAHDVVARVRRAIRVKQVGHAGTLDPMATGVLPVAVGKACRLLRFLHGGKVYLAEILLGQQTDTDDIEGKVLATSSSQPPPPAILEALQSFQGKQMQIPPKYSAIHINGERLYDLARQGKAPDNIPAREVIIEAIDALGIEFPVVKARITCSAGTYIRSIARDLGEKLQTYACLQALTREAAGPFKLMSAINLCDLEETVKEGNWLPLLISPQSVLDLHDVKLDEHQARLIRLGQSVLVETASPPENLVMALCEDELVAVCRCASETTGTFVRIQPEVVIANG